MNDPTTVYVVLYGNKAFFRCKTDVRYRGEGVTSERAEEWRRHITEDIKGFYAGKRLPEPHIVVLDVIKGGKVAQTKEVA